MDYKGLTIEIQQDEDAESPRDPKRSDNLGTMVCFHKRYRLGDDTKYRYQDYSGWEELEAAIEEDAKAEGGMAVILPIFMYDHSGITIRCHGFSDIDSAKWDWGQIGFIYVTKDKVRKEYGRCTKKAMERARGVLLAEVETYDQFLTGDVWGYMITDPEGKVMDAVNVESCWGFFGRDYCEQAAKDVVDGMLKRQEKMAHA